MGIKEYILIAIAVVLFGCGFLFGFKWNAGRIASLEGSVSACKTDNQTDMNTIASLTVQINSRNSLCDKRLAIKQAEIDKLTKLLEVQNAKAPAILSDDAYLSALNGMYAESNYKGGYCESGDSAPAAGSPNVSSPFLYCFSSKQDIVNLIRNITLIDGDRHDCREIVSSLTNTKGDK
jgi:hypothetical protein